MINFAEDSQKNDWCQPMKINNYPSLFKINLELTYRCPRKCIYCIQKDMMTSSYGNEHVSTRKELKTQDIFSLFRQASKMEVKWINLTGGEPFLRKDILRLIEFASELSIKTGLPTKHAFSKSQMNSLKDAGLCRIGISLDSHIATVANYLVGDEHYFVESVENIRLAKAAGLEVMLLPVINRLTVREFPDFIRFAERLSVDLVRPQLYSGDPLQIRFSNNRQRKSGRQDLNLKDPVETLKWINTIKSPILEKNRPELKTRKDTESSYNSDYSTTCAIGKGLVSVRPDGKVYFCPSMSDYTVGDIIKESLEDIWYHGKIKKILFPSRKSFWGTKCYSCSYLDECNKEGRCTERCLRHYGRAFAPDPWLCSHFKNQIDFSDRDLNERSRKGTELG